MTLLCVSYKQTEVNYSGLWLPINVFYGIQNIFFGRVSPYSDPFDAVAAAEKHPVMPCWA